MKLAQRLKKKIYRPASLPKPSKEETEKQKFNRLFLETKRDFRRALDKQIRSGKDYDFLDFYVPYYCFKDIFVSYQFGQYKYDEFKYVWRKDSYYYKFLLWLQDEGFQREAITTHWKSDPDDDDTYSFRVYWR